MGTTEKKDKQLWHGEWRSCERERIGYLIKRVNAAETADVFDDFVLILPREVSNPWLMRKDGKWWHSPEWLADPVMQRRIMGK